MDRVKYTKELIPVKVHEYGRNYQNLASSFIDKYGMSLSENCLAECTNTSILKGYSDVGSDLKSKIRGFLLPLISEVDIAKEVTMNPNIIPYVKDSYDDMQNKSYGKNLERIVLACLNNLKTKHLVKSESMLIGVIEYLKRKNYRASSGVIDKANISDWFSKLIAKN